MVDLETRVEDALVDLLETDEVLAGLEPTRNEQYADREPREDDAGNSTNPSLSIKCTKLGLAIKQTCYFNIGAEITLWMEVDEETKKQGLEDLYHRLEILLDDPDLHVTINAMPGNNTDFICEGTYNRRSTRNISGNRYQRVYSFTLICVARI